MQRILLAAVFLFISLVANAEKKTPVEKAQAKTDEMQKGLTLTADQHKKIYDINLKAYTAIAEYDAKDPSKKLKKKQKDMVQEMRDDQYKKVLSADQFKKYKELKKQEKAEEEKLKKQLNQLKQKK
jgi:ABC-type oligopeptide transport system ATPase subunit